MSMAGKTESPNYWVNQRDKMGIARTSRNMAGFQTVVSLRHGHCELESKPHLNKIVSKRRCAIVKQCVSVRLLANVLFSRICMYKNIARPSSGSGSVERLKRSDRSSYSLRERGNAIVTR